MRVVVLHNLRAGGAHRRLEEQVRRLHVEVVEVCPSTALPVTDDPFVLSFRPAAPERARCFRPPLRYLDLFALQVVWRRLADAVTSLRPDVVFANPCQFLQTPSALLALSAPTLYFCDEPRRVDYEPRATSGRNSLTRLPYAPLHRAERLLDRRAVARATRLATNSRHSATAIRAAYGREAEVLPMGVSAGFRPGNERPRHLLSVGTLIEDKGHELVLRAAALTRRRWPVLVVAPRANDEAQARLERLARHVGVALSVRVAISDAELVRAYRQAQATLYLALREPFGLVAIEAQACGCPVIVSAEGGLPETLLPGVTGWAVPRDPAPAAVCVDELDHPETRARMSCAAAAHGAGASWERSASLLEDVLESVAHAR
jgi:glycosyltransferase involved in cell wall biosynthesis